MKTEYQVTFGYTAVITVTVKADDEQSAKDQAHKIFNEKVRTLPYKGKRNPVNLEDDTYSDYGILDMDSTWNQL